MPPDSEIPRGFMAVLALGAVLGVGGLLWMAFAVDRAPEPMRDRTGWSNPSPPEQQLSPDLPMDPRTNSPLPPPPPPPPLKVTVPASAPAS